MYKCVERETHDTNPKSQTKNQSNTKQQIHDNKNPSPCAKTIGRMGQANSTK